MANLRICRGSIKLNGSNIVKIGYGPFSGTPSVTATVVGTEKNGANVCIKSRNAGGATLAAFYNGGLMLTEGTIDWIAVGPTSEIRRCGCTPIPHACSVCTVYG